MDEKTPLEGLGEGAPEDLKADAMREAVEDEFLSVHNRMGPMIWALAFDLCRENPSSARLNAVLNSLLTSALGFVVCVTPDEAPEDHNQMIRDKFAANFDGMLAEREKTRETVSQLGNYQGRQMLLQHQNQALAMAVQSLVAAMTGGIVPGQSEPRMDQGTVTKLDEFKRKKNGEAPKKD